MIARVFPRRTSMTPIDDYVFIGEPSLFVPSNIDEVHVSVTFTYDINLAEKIAKRWETIAPVKIGGPALGMRGEDFTPGMYLKKGHVITSRGCNNKCWFCSVHKREGSVRELPITEGWILHDDNLLQCSENHVISVFNMLEKYKSKVEIRSGIEARLLKQWHVEWMSKTKVNNLILAYDTEDDYEALVSINKLLRDGKMLYEKTRAYLLCGYKNDTIEKAEARADRLLRIGIFPMAMLFKDEDGSDAGLRDSNWRKFQHFYTRPAIMRKKMNEYKDKR